jgi:hypothetical protein
MNHIPLPKSTDSLHDRAQEILERLGYAGTPYDATEGWFFLHRWNNHHPPPEWRYRTGSRCSTRRVSTAARFTNNEPLLGRPLLD